MAQGHQSRASSSIVRPAAASSAMVLAIPSSTMFWCGTQEFSGIRLQNTTGTTTITNTTLTSSATASGPLFHVDGGDGIVTFGSTDFGLNRLHQLLWSGRVNKPLSQPVVTIENMTGGRVDMSNSNVSSTGGGILIQNNTGGAATIDNASLTNGTGVGITVVDSAGTYIFRKTNAALGAITIDNAAQQAILINNASGQITFSDPLLITESIPEGIEISQSSGSTTLPVSPQSAD